MIQPVLSTGVLTLLTGRGMKIPTDGLPGVLLAYSGMAAWLYFTHVLTKSSTRAILLLHGRIVQDGSVSEVLDAYYPAKR